MKQVIVPIRLKAVVQLDENKVVEQIGFRVWLAKFIIRIAEAVGDMKIKLEVKIEEDKK